MILSFFKIKKKVIASFFPTLLPSLDDSSNLFFFSIEAWICYITLSEFFHSADKKFLKLKMSELNRNQESSSTPLSSSAKKCSEYVLVSRKELAMLKREVRICTHYMAELSSHPTRKSLNYIKQKLAASKPIELHSQNVSFGRL